MFGINSEVSFYLETIGDTYLLYLYTIFGGGMGVLKIN